MPTRISTLAALTSASLLTLGLAACGTSGHSFSLASRSPGAGSSPETPGTGTGTDPSNPGGGVGGGSGGSGGAGSGGSGSGGGSGGSGGSGGGGGGGGSNPGGTPTPTPSTSLADALDDVAQVVVVDNTLPNAGDNDGQLLGVAVGADRATSGQLASAGVASGGRLVDVQAVGGAGSPPNPLVTNVQQAIGPTAGRLAGGVAGSGASNVLEQGNNAAGQVTNGLLGGTGLLNANAGGTDVIGGPPTTPAIGVNVLSPGNAQGTTISADALSGGQLVNVQGLGGAGGASGGAVGQVAGQLNDGLGGALAPVGGVVGGVTGAVSGPVTGLTGTGGPLAPVTPVVDNVVGAVSGVVAGGGAQTPGLAGGLLGR